MSQGDELAHCFWDSDDMMVGSRKEGSRDVGVGEGTLESHGRGSQKGPMTA